MKVYFKGLDTTKDKINLIRDLRQVFGMDLRESKGLIDQGWIEADESMLQKMQQSPLKVHLPRDESSLKDALSRLQKVSSRLLARWVNALAETLEKWDIP